MNINIPFLSDLTKKKEEKKADALLSEHAGKENEILAEIVKKIDQLASSFDEKIKPVSDKITKIEARPFVDKEAFDKVAEQVTKLEKTFGELSTVYESMMKQINNSENKK